MWEDFVIGDTGGHSAATTVVGHPGLSGNSTAYWWHDHDLDVGGKIVKDSTEGRVITRMIEAAASGKQLDKWILEVAVANMGAPKVVAMIARARAKSFDAGKESKASEIKKALGL